MQEETVSDESLGLSEVQAAFREAESRFTDLASAAADLTSVSEQLSEARASVLEAAGRLVELAEANTAASQQLAAATRAIEATDPAEIQAKLRDLAENVEANERATSEALSSLRTEMQRSTRLQIILTSITLLAVILVGALSFVL